MSRRKSSSVPPALTADPLTLVRNLDAETIRNRLEDLDREREALLVLLRVAQRAERPKPLRKGGGRA